MSVPNRTWKPWKPVARKKIEPKQLSAREKEQRLYSSNCNKRKASAKMRVTPRALNLDEHKLEVRL